MLKIPREPSDLYSLLLDLIYHNIITTVKPVLLCAQHHNKVVLV